MRDCRMNGEIQGEKKKSEKSSRVQSVASTVVDNGISRCLEVDKGCEHAGEKGIETKKKSAIPLSSAAGVTQLVPLSPRTIVPLRTATRRSIT